MKQSCPLTPDSDEKKPFHIPIRVALFDSQGRQIPAKQEVLELKETEQHFTFTDLSEQPVISLLGEFSAPIKLKHALSQDNLLFLLRHETDGFSKWDAAQNLVLNLLNECLQQPSNKWQIPPALISAFKHVLLDDSLDADLRAELLNPPGFEDVAAMLDSVDVNAVETVRDFFHQQLGWYLYEPAQSLYQKLWQMEEHRMDGPAYGRRKLRNLCLWLMMKGKEAATLDVCQQQFIAAQTMTDQIASFSLLVNCNNQGLREQAIEDFYKQWSKEDLVLDKWFALQATSKLPDTLTHVKALLKHSAFSMKNPNKVRALISSFCMANPSNFHATDGSGYEFLAEMLVTLDKINPQIAARLANPFTRWQRYDKPRQILMRKQLQELAKLTLSRDLAEVVSKSLVSEIS